MLNYVFLILAIVAEAAGTTLLKMSEQFTKLVPSIALITISGIYFFKQMPDLGAIIGLILIVSGVAVLNLFSKMDIH